MRHINLLPWREGMRREQQRRFSRQTLGLLLGLVAVLVLIYGQNASQLSEQRKRNHFLQQQINALQEEINGYRGLGGNGGSQEGMQAVATLIGGREQLVRVLDELPRRVPEGITLTEIRQQGQQLRVSGIADSSAHVSRLLMELEQSALFSSARLEVMKAAEQRDNGARNSFELELDMKQTQGG